LSGPTDERFPQAIFVGARRLADKHEIGIDVADTDDHLRSGGDEVGTMVAGKRQAVQVLHLVRLGGAGKGQGFWELGAGFWVLGLGFWALGAGFGVLGV